MAWLSYQVYIDVLHRPLLPDTTSVPIHSKSTTASVSSSRTPLVRVHLFSPRRPRSLYTQIPSPYIYVRPFIDKSGWSRDWCVRREQTSDNQQQFLHIQGRIIAGTANRSNERTSLILLLMGITHESCSMRCGLFLEFGNCLWGNDISQLTR